MNKLIKVLKEDFSTISKSNLSKFRFRERMKLERTLYLILLEVANSEISGFNQQSKTMAINNTKNIQQVRLIEKLFHLKDFLKNISSKNAYERDIALETIGTDRVKVFKLIDSQINKIEELSLTVDMT